MAARSLFLALILAAAMFLSRDGVQRANAVSADFVVDTFFPACATPNMAGMIFTSIEQAIDTATTQGTTIYVCPGTYSERLIRMDTGNVDLMGPGVTPEADGDAIVRKSTLAPLVSDMFFITSDHVRLRGLYIDAAPQPGWPNAAITPIESTGLYSEITDNTIVNNNLDEAMHLSGFNPQVLRNTLNNGNGGGSGGGIFCSCDSAYIANNTIGPNSGPVGIQVRGPNAMILDNVVNGSKTNLIDSNLGVVSGNTMDLLGLDVGGLYAAGDYVTISNNTIRNGDSWGINIDEPNATGSTSVSIVGNTIENVVVGIDIRDNDGANARMVSAVVGGAEANSNTFRNNTVLVSNSQPTNVNAEYNDWGLCTLAAIEAKVTHKPDNANYGTVDFDPFVIGPPCATPTPTPSPTPTSSPSPTASSSPTQPTTMTPTASPTPTTTATLSPTTTLAPTPTESTTNQETWGDSDCDGNVTSRDNQVLLRSVLQQPPLSQTEPCPDIGDDIGDQMWGDWDCDGNVSSRDNQALLRSVLLQPPLSQTEPCPDVGL